MKKTKSLVHISCTALFTGLTVLCACISLSMGDVRFSLQLFAVLLAAGLLPLADGLCAIAAYILLGALGAPVFAGFNGGFSTLLGPTGGFIIGFLFTVPVSVFFSRVGLRKGKAPGLVRQCLAFAAGTAACYLLGCLHFYIYMPEKGIAYAFAVAVLPYLLPDCAKIFMAAVLVKRLRPYSEKLFHMSVKKGTFRKGPVLGAPQTTGEATDGCALSTKAVSSCSTEVDSVTKDLIPMDAPSAESFLKDAVSADSVLKDLPAARPFLTDSFPKDSPAESSIPRDQDFREMFRQDED